jgi:hypothetical protein
LRPSLQKNFLYSSPQGSHFICMSAALVIIWQSASYKFLNCVSDTKNSSKKNQGGAVLANSFLPASF